MGPTVITRRIPITPMTRSKYVGSVSQSVSILIKRISVKVSDFQLFFGFSHEHDDKDTKYGLKSGTSSVFSVTLSLT